MKFYIVDNGSKYLKFIHSRLNTYDSVTVRYSPHEPLHAGDADIIILSGGMKNEVVDLHEDGYPWYHHEFDLIRNTDKPILGICLGLQMTTVALGGTLKKLPNLIETNKPIQVTTTGKKAVGRKDMYVHKKHQWVADDLTSTGFDVLATSSEGVELVHHPERRIIATQFHPEIDADEHSEQLFWDLISVITKSGQKSPILAQ